MDRTQLKERIKKLSPEEREKLKEYGDALKEIKKAMKELLNKKEIKKEIGGNMSSGLSLSPE
jgi:glucosamine 6-phosphate synthetase-like amidotransferase/phosphosugar isomerase protein